MTVPRTGKLLLVDDEADIREVLGLYLADLGYEVLTAENGREALALFDREHPRIVLSDIKMPAMDGITLLGEIKARDPEAEVIMITGHGDMDLAIKSLKLEATDFVTKPINDDALDIALGRAHERIEMRRQIREYTENLEALVAEKSAAVVALERRLAVGYTVEGLSSALWDLAGELSGGIRYFNEMPCFVSVHNRTLETVAVNPLFRSRMGAPLGRSSREIYGADGAPDESCPVAETFATGLGQRSRRTLRTKEGTTLPVMVHTAPIRSRDEAVELVVAISADIAEVARLQEALAATQLRYQQLFDTVPCYITVQDRNLAIVEANQRFRDHFGDPDGAPCYAAYKGREDACSHCPVAETFADGRSHQRETVVTDRNGDQINVLITTSAIRDSEGTVVQVMEMSTDITQIRQLQDHLANLGLLIGSISHGIKGLLTGLDGGMYLVSSGFARKSDDQIREGWEIVRQMVGRIRSMVLDILYYAKDRELNRAGTEVSAFVTDVVTAVEARMRRAGIAFDQTVDPGLDLIEIDADALHSALVNILENAVDACEADPPASGHRITLAVAPAPAEDEIVFEIRDDGIGMDAETRENLFTLFFSSKGPRGTGLGLFIAHRTVERHGGTIEVTAAPGEGASFRVRLPRRAPEPEAEETAEPKP